MRGPTPASAPDDLFEAIATLLEPGQREYFYQRMLYFRQLRPEDELLRLVEAIGLLALLIREAPHAVARERGEPWLDRGCGDLGSAIRRVAGAVDRPHRQNCND